MATPVDEMSNLGLTTPLPSEDAMVTTPTTPAEVVLLASPTSTTTEAPPAEEVQPGLGGGEEQILVTPSLDFEFLFDVQTEEIPLDDSPPTPEALMMATAQPVVKLTRIPKKTSKQRKLPQDQQQHKTLQQSGRGNAKQGKIKKSSGTKTRETPKKSKRRATLRIDSDGEEGDVTVPTTSMTSVVSAPPTSTTTEVVVSTTLATSVVSAPPISTTTEVMVPTSEVTTSATLVVPAPPTSSTPEVLAAPTLLTSGPVDMEEDEILGLSEEQSLRAAAELQEVIEKQDEQPIALVASSQRDSSTSGFNTIPKVDIAQQEPMEWDEGSAGNLPPEPALPLQQRRKGRHYSPIRIAIPSPSTRFIPGGFEND